MCYYCLWENQAGDVWNRETADSCSNFMAASVPTIGNLNVTPDKEKLDSRTHPLGYFSQLRGISQSLRAGDCRAGASFDPQIIFIGPLTQHVSKLNLVSGDFIEWDVCLCPKFNIACRIDWFYEQWSKVATEKHPSCDLSSGWVELLKEHLLLVPN